MSLCTSVKSDAIVLQLTTLFPSANTVEQRFSLKKTRRGLLKLGIVSIVQDSRAAFAYVVTLLRALCRLTSHILQMPSYSCIISRLNRRFASNCSCHVCRCSKPKFWQRCQPVVTLLCRPVFSLFVLHGWGKQKRCRTSPSIPSLSYLMSPACYCSHFKTHCLLTFGTFLCV